MTTTTLINEEGKVYTFTKVDAHTTAVRSGWTRRANGSVHWQGKPKHMQRYLAAGYYRQLLANGYHIKQ